MARTTAASNLVRELGLEQLDLRTKRRFPRQPEQVDLLPEVESFDTEAMKVSLVEIFEGEPPASRHNMLDQSQKLLKNFSGRPEILFWNALAISYLRRRTPHSAKAKNLFFKIWDRQGSWVAKELSARWLVSTLQTFADHGRTADEIRCGTTGFMYGNLIKVYETEIASAYSRTGDPQQFSGGSIKGLHGFQPGSDILLNINKFAMASTSSASPASEALLRLMAAIRDSTTIFSRTDDITRQKGEGFLAFSGHINH